MMPHLNHRHARFDPGRIMGQQSRLASDRTSPGPIPASISINEQDSRHAPMD